MSYMNKIPRNPIFCNLWLLCCNKSRMKRLPAMPALLIDNFGLTLRQRDIYNDYPVSRVG